MKSLFAASLWQKDEEGQSRTTDPREYSLGKLTSDMLYRYPDKIIASLASDIKIFLIDADEKYDDIECREHRVDLRDSIPNR
jgi:hypothetical protein